MSGDFLKVENVGVFPAPSVCYELLGVWPMDSRKNRYLLAPNRQGKKFLSREAGKCPDWVSSGFALADS